MSHEQAPTNVLVARLSRPQLEQLVTALLASAEALGLADDAVAKLRDNTAVLALSISPHVGALRNAAYSSGFTAHGSRAAA